MRQAFRPYVKLVGVTDQAPVTVNLTDSSGTAIDCNYIQVEDVSGHTGAGGGDDFFLVIPNGLSTAEGEANFPDASGITNNSASGIAGGIASVPTGTVVLSLAPSDVSNSIRLSQSNTSDHLYAVTYGNVRVTNSFADNKLPTGN
jgi:hypothetical protein